MTVISVHFQGKPLNITVIQVYALTTRVLISFPGNKVMVEEKRERVKNAESYRVGRKEIPECKDT